MDYIEKIYGAEINHEFSMRYLGLWASDSARYAGSAGNNNQAVRNKKLRPQSSHGAYLLRTGLPDSTRRVPAGEVAVVKKSL